mgnify:CR=1 FL=1
MPLRYDQPVHTFQPCLPFPARITSTKTGTPTAEHLISGYNLIEVDPDNRYFFVPTRVSPSRLANTVQNFNDIHNGIQADTMAHGLISFTGISRQAKLSVKLIEILESIASPSGAWIPFITPSAVPDSKAMDNAYKIRQSMPDGFPARDNDWGSIWAGLKSMAPQVLKVLTTPEAETAISMLPGGGLINKAMMLGKKVTSAPRVGPSLSRVQGSPSPPVSANSSTSKSLKTAVRAARPARTRQARRR